MHNTYHSNSIRSSDGADDSGCVGFTQSLSHDEISEIEIRNDKPCEQQYRGKGQK